jgi:hypothetical protein
MMQQPQQQHPQTLPLPDTNAFASRMPLVQNGGLGPSAGGMGPSAGGMGPSAGCMGPSAGGMGPSAGGMGPSAPTGGTRPHVLGPDDFYM